ncbi:MAG: hypothetical protein WEA24_12225 [Gemmatimonadota bacterium]
MTFRVSFLLAAALLLFLLQGFAALLAALLGPAGASAGPAPGAVALVPLLAVAAAVCAPALPLERWLERGNALVLTARTAALAGAGLVLLPGTARLAAAALAAGAGGLYLTMAVGLVERRALAGAAAAALLTNQLLAALGMGWEAALRPVPAPAQLLLAAGALALTAARRFPPEPTDPATPTLERRAGGLRLRGAVAFGAILFLEHAVLGRTHVAAALTGLAPWAVGALLLAVGAAGVVMLLTSEAPARSRSAVVLLAGAALAGALTPHWIAGWPGALAVAAGHGAALLLLARALNPASGRRQGWTTVGGLLVFAALAATHAATAGPAPGLALGPALDPATGAGNHAGAVWAVAVGGLVLALSMLILPAER